MTGIRQRLGEPVDAWGFRCFRISLGVLLLVQVCRYFIHGWIDRQFHEPAVLFPWPGLEFFRPWPRPGMQVHLAGLGVLAAGIALGFQIRACAALFCAGFTALWLMDRVYYLNHYYLISLLTGLMALLPASKDRLPRGTRDLLRLQVALVYCFAGLAKLQSDWLLEAQPLRIWFCELGGPSLLRLPAVAFAASWAGAAFDLALPFALFVPHLRPWALSAAALFHLLTALLFPIGLFPWVMMASLCLFLERPAGTAPADSVRPVRPAVLGAACLYLAVQVFLPLRGGPATVEALWTESGFRFSWRVMVMEKTADVEFRFRDPASGEEWGELPSKSLTPLQVRLFSTQPDLILYHAQRRARDLSRVRGRGVEVRARVRVSLNGRPSQALVNPDVDLARLPSDPAPEAWLLPLTPPSPGP